MEKVIELAKQIIHEELERRGFAVRQIILFGSRARGDFRPDSDWDFFIIVDRDIPDTEYRTIASDIRLRFVQAGFCGDIFIQSEKAVRGRKNNTGFLTYYVLKEGVTIDANSHPHF